MIMKETSVMMVYALSLILFFNYSSPLMFWILMEFNLLSFILLLSLDKGGIFKQESLSFVIYYFIIQSSASILFLSNFMFSEWFSIFNYDTMFFVSLVFKIGLFPLFFWVFNISSFLNPFSLTLLLTTQKIPLFSVLYSSSSFILVVLLFLSFVSGSCLLFFSPNLLKAMVSSSISYSFIFFFLFNLNLSNFLVFYFLYSLFLGMVLYTIGTNFGDSSDSLVSLAFFFFLGLPPLSLFFLKFLVTSEFVQSLSNLECLTFWLFGFVGLTGYIKIFHSSFFWMSPLYSSNKSYFRFSLSIFFVILVFFSFLV